MPTHVSIIVPCYNEAGFIARLCDDIIQQDYPRECLEIIFADGRSSDNTREILAGYAANDNRFIILDNDKRYVPFALNKAIRHSKGDVIVRMDAHARYPSCYVSALVAKLFELNADNVGGSWDTVPGSGSLTAKTIAWAMSSAFGMGNAWYRLKTDTVRKVDTVPFGCYRKDVFDKIGLFDEELLRNQDDEFNGRLINSGGRIFLVPGIRITYFARSSLKKVLRMFYQYGYFKPLVNIKLKKPATIRQFVPLTFLLSLLLCLILTLFIPTLWYLLPALVILHLFAGFMAGLSSLKKSGDPSALWLLPFVFFLVHLSYGYGYLEGIFKFYTGRKSGGIINSSR